MKKLLLVSLIIALITGLILSSCGTTSSPATPAKPSNPAPSASSNAPSSPPSGALPSLPPNTLSKPAPESTKTLKVGIVGMFSSASTLEWINAIKLMAELDNKNGGLAVGGDKYKVEIVDYDNNNNSQNAEIAAINRLVYQDGVKYVVGQAQYESAWLPVTEQNKVIVMNANNSYNISNLPMYKYCFAASGVNSSMSAITGWFAKNYPEEMKSLVLAFPDNQMGHFLNDMVGGTWKAFGANPTTIYYPASQQDLSSLGTKVVSMKPGIFMGMAGGAVDDGKILNAAYQAGYKGKMISVTLSSFLAMKAAIIPEAFEGFTSAGTPFDFDPPLVQAAVDFKAAWIAKYGKWEGADVAFAQNYSALRAAWVQAGSVDTEKVAEVLSNGLEYESLFGPMQMISRPDLGNDRTTDSVQTYYIRQTQNGQPKLVATISPEEALSYMRLAFPPLPPGATPPGPPMGPPPGGPPPG
jgi:branched-chain amino acid transport system substrate-binding protein